MYFLSCFNLLKNIHQQDCFNIRLNILVLYISAVKIATCEFSWL